MRDLDAADHEPAAGDEAVAVVSEPCTDAHARRLCGTRDAC
jgi:hypothetical protein